MTTIITLNKHFKIDQKSMEKNKFIREIFEIDDILPKYNQNNRITRDNNNSNGNNANCQMNYNSNNSEDESLNENNTIKSIYTTSQKKEISSINNFNTKIYFRPVSEHGYNRNMGFKNSQDNKNSNYNSNSKVENYENYNRDKRSQYINSVIDNKVGNERIEKQLTKKQASNRANNISDTSNYNTNSKENKKESKDKSSFFSKLKNMIFGDEEEKEKQVSKSMAKLNYNDNDFDNHVKRHSDKKLPSVSKNNLNISKENSNSSDINNNGNNDTNLSSSCNNLSKYTKDNYSTNNVKTPPPKKNSNLQFSFNNQLDSNKNTSNTTNNTDINDNNPYLLYIPCLNCNSMIHLNEVEDHSNNCFRLNVDVEKVEQSKYAYHVVDFKLKKIYEHILSLQAEEEQNKPRKSAFNNNVKRNTVTGSSINSNNLSKEAHIFHILGITIKDTINCSKIASSSLTNLKKFLINLDSITHSFKGSWTTLILIDRCRILIQDKMGILKKSLKELNESKRNTVYINNNNNNITNNSTSNSNFGTISMSSKSSNSHLDQLKASLIKEKEEKEKLNEYLENEKQMIMRKTAVLKESTKQYSQIQDNNNSSINKETRDNRETVRGGNYSNNRNSNIEEEEKRGHTAKPNMNLRININNNDTNNKNNINSDNYNNYDDYNNEVDSNPYSSYNNTQNFDTEEDKLYNNIDVKQVKIPKNILQDINSDIESRNMEDISDCTSLTSNTSSLSYKDNLEAPLIQETKQNNHIIDAKRLYQDFVKAVLKVKFEKIHSSHKGQDVPEKVLFKECIKRNIPELQWQEFIINELKNPDKYSEYFKSNIKKMRVQKNQGLILDTIQEEAQ